MRNVFAQNAMNAMGNLASAIHLDRPVKEVKEYYDSLTKCLDGFPDNEPNADLAFCQSVAFAAKEYLDWKLPMNPITKIIMERDNMDRKEAEDLIAEVQEAIGEYSPEDLLHDELGLEPDFVFDLLDFSPTKGI